MPQIATITLSIAMLAVFLFTFVGIGQLRKRGDPEARKRGILMLIFSAVLLANVLIWTV